MKIVQSFVMLLALWVLPGGGSAFCQNNPNDPLYHQKNLRDGYKAEFDKFNTGVGTGNNHNAEYCEALIFDNILEDKAAALWWSVGDFEDEWIDVQSYCDNYSSPLFFAIAPQYVYDYFTQGMRNDVDYMWETYLEHEGDWSLCNDLVNNIGGSKVLAQGKFQEVQEAIADAEADANITWDESNAINSLVAVYGNRVEDFKYDVQQASMKLVADEVICDDYNDDLDAWAALMFPSIEYVPL